MPKFDESQMKVALSAIRDARRKYSDRPEVDPSESARIQANRHAIEKLFMPALIKAGFEVEKFDKILAKSRTDLVHILEKQHADAVKLSSSAREFLRHGVDGRRKTIDYLGTLTAASKPFDVSLDTPFLVWQTPGMFFDTSHVEPWHSWAKVKVESPSRNRGGSEDLTFYFGWENPSDKYAVINVTTWLVLIGFLQATAPGGFWGGDRYSSVSIDAHLHLIEWWNDPPTEPLEQAIQFQNNLLPSKLVPVEASAGGMFDHERTVSDNLFRGCELGYQFFLIPPNEAVGFAVVATVRFGFGADNGNHGGILADFDSGDFQIMGPAVLITILT
jgi:hypothetical protein